MTEILSQEFHKWAHQTPSQSHSIVNFLQSNGILLGKTSHALHHIEPYDGNYCIISGICNEPLDRLGGYIMHIFYT